MKKPNWEQEEEKLKQPRKRKSDRAKKMRVSGKGVFNIQKEILKQKKKK